MTDLEHKRLGDFLIEYAEAAEQLGDEYKRRQEKQKAAPPRYHSKHNKRR